MESALGGLIDHSIDATFVTVALGAFAIRDAVPMILPVLVAASFAVIPVGWMVVLGVLWVAGAVLGAAQWNETVWIPLLASILVSALWMTVFFLGR